MDGTQDRKAALDARFKEKAAQRQADKVRRRAELDANNDPAESSAAFWTTFNAEVACMLDMSVLGRVLWVLVVGCVRLADVCLFVAQQQQQQHNSGSSGY